MTNQFTGSSFRVTFARFQHYLIVALSGVAAAFSPMCSSAQQINYYDFNIPAANPGQTSTSCNANSAASGVLLCLNNTGGGLGFIQDNSTYALKLTDQYSMTQSSSVWYSIPQNVAGGFTTWYAFKITAGSSPAGDGLAFVIQNALGGGLDQPSTCAETGSGLTALGAGGGCLGYGGMDNSLAIEADTFVDSYDPYDLGFGAYDASHIALQSCGLGAANSPVHYVSNAASPLVPTSCLVSLGGTYGIASYPNQVRLSDGNVHQVVVVYNGPNDSPANTIFVYLDPTFDTGTHTPVAGSTPILSGPFNIAQYVNLNNGTANIGFTAATGGSTEQNELMGFTFTPHDSGNANVCPAGATTPAPCSSTIPVTFNVTQDTPIGSIQVVTQGVPNLDFAQANGGNCSGTILAGNSCTLDVTFTPLAPGLRLGAVNLLNGNQILLATKLIYGIGQGPAAAFGPGTQSALNLGGYVLNEPKGVAVDAAGDVFIEDTGSHTPNHNVVKIAADGTQTVVATGLSYPQGIAVDGAGNLFIADNDQNEVLEFPVGCTDITCQKIVDSSFRSQLGVAVDGMGDVYFSDYQDGEVVEVPANGGAKTVVYTAGSGLHPVGVAVDGAGDLFIAVFPDSPTITPGKVVKIPAGCTNSGCQTTVGVGWFEPESVAVDAAGDIFVADEAPKVVEVPAGCINNSACQITVSGILAYGVAVDGKGNVFLPDLDNTPAGPSNTSDPYSNQVLVINRAQPPSLNFANTNLGSTSGDSPKAVSVQNVGNQPLTGSLALSFSGNFTENEDSNCSSAFPLALGAICGESFSFIPLSAGPLTGTAIFTDNALNASPGTQIINLTGVGVPVVLTTAIVPNVVGQTQGVATTTITAASLVLGTVSTASSSSVPLGSVISQNPAAGAQANVGSAVQVLVSTGPVPQPTTNPLTLQNNYLVTGDYVSAGVTLRGTGQGGVATGSITIPGGSQGVPDGADVLAAYLYWESVESTPSASSASGTFRGYSITGQQIGNDRPFTDGTFSGTLRVYRADVNAFLPARPNGIRFASGSHSVTLPDGGGSILPLTEGASLVVVYRVLSPNFPLKAVVIYDGSAVPSTGSMTQTVQGFYDAVGGANGTGEVTNIFAGNGSWNNISTSTTLGQSSQFTATLNPGSAYAAVILSTPINNSDNDGILDAWKAGPAAGDFHAGQPGYYDVKTGAWVGLPGAQHGHKDLFVQLDYMCGALLSDGSCDPTKENLFPSPDTAGNDPLAMVQQAFSASGVQLHLQIGNAVPEDTCTDSPGQPLCQFPSQPGVIGWKNSLEFSKLWPRNFASCATGGDCTTRFPYGQKDSYHYVLFGHSLAVPAWNSRFGTLTSISVANGVTTIGTADRGTGINQCPSRITISGVLGNPSLNGVYNTTGCADSKTISLNTPGVPNWSYPNSTLPEPVIGLISGTITSISGYSDLGGADSAVTLGLWLTAPNQDMSKKANVIAGTLFHEIGHTLGLSHGGLYYDTPNSYVPTFEANCKPNYQSVMNYLFQLDLVGPGHAVVYSNQQLTTLSESAPVAQLTDLFSNPATFPTSAWYVPFTSGVSASPATRHCDGTPLKSDSSYRVDAPIAPITPAWASGQDINFDGQLNTQMRGYNDVANMDLRQVGATGGQFASLATVLSFGASAAPLNIGAGGNVTLGSGGTIALGSGGNVTLGSGGNVTLGSGGTITMGSGGNVTLGSGGNVTLGSGGTVTPGSSGVVTLSIGGNVTLGSGGTITLGSGGNVTLGSGGTVTLGSGGTISLGSGGTVTLGSGGTYTIDSSGGTITLGSGGNVILGSGGNVTLGSGGTIALGSGGTVTLGSGGNVTLGSGGTIALGSGGTVALGSGGNVTLGSGGTIALGSGGTITLGSGGNVTLGSGGTVTLGSGGDLSGSGGNVTLGSGGTATLGAGGTVTLGSGGNVTLGSGGNVTLGSGGTITMGSSGGNVTLGSGGTVTLGSGGDTITVSSSGGTVTLGSGGDVTLGSGGTIALGSGGTITIPPGGSYNIDSSGGTITLGSGGNVTLGSGGNVTLGSGGTIALGSGGNVTLGSGGNVTLGSGGTITLGSGGNVTLGSGGTVTLGSGGVVALGSGGNVTLGSGGNIALGSGGNVTLGSGGSLSDELTYETANSVVRPPSSPTETTTPAGVRVDWMAPAFGVVQTYTISRSSDGATPILIGSVSGVNGNPPATEFIDTNPDLTSQTVVYTISTTLAPVTLDPTQRQSPASPPAVLTNDQTISLGPLPSSVTVGNPPTVTATAMSSGTPNGLQVNFSATGSCSIGSQSIAAGVSSASVTLNSTGSCTITASQPGSSPSQSLNPPYYNAANSVSGSFTVLPQGSNTTSQTINFPLLQNLQYGNSFSLSATSSSGLPVSFSASGPCTASGAITGVGVCAITASAPASGNYSAASVTQSFTIFPAVLKVTATNLTSVYGQPLPSLTFTYSGFVNSETPSVVSGAPALSTTATSVSGPGSYPITVSTGTLAAKNYSFLYVRGTLTITGPIVNVSPSNINFGTVPQGSITTKTVTVTNTGNAPVTINQPLISIVHGGNSNEFVSVNLCPSSLAAGKSCTITVSFVAGPYYTQQTATLQIMDSAPGSPQMVSLTALVLIPQTITFTINPPASAANKSTFTVAATGGASGNPVTFTSSGSCSNVGATYTMTGGTGTCSVIANQAGNATYAAAAQVTKTVTATLIAQTITFTTNPPASAVYRSKFTVAATGGASGNAVTFTSSGSCSNAGATYTMTSGTGTCSVIANQAGNATYAAATPVTKTVTATYAVATLSPTSLAFGTVSSGRSSSPKVVTLTNTGVSPLIINSIGITGANPGNFVQTNTCPASSSSLLAGKSCTISVTFNSSGKAATANLAVIDNTQAGTQTVSLSGN